MLPVKVFLVTKFKKALVFVISNVRLQRKNLERFSIERCKTKQMTSLRSIMKELDSPINQSTLDANAYSRESLCEPAVQARK